MQICSKCHIEKDLSEFNKDKSKSSGYYSCCKACKSKYNIETKSNRAKTKRIYYEKNKYLILQKSKAKYQKNKDAVIKKNALYRKNNAEKLKETKRIYYLKNLDKIKAKMKIYHKSYKENNRHVLNANDAKRHAAELQRTPKWLTKEDINKIKQIYYESRMLTLETGVKHHVDHIIPLQGKIVSGLHVPSNLRVITETENVRKNNRYRLEE